MKKRSDNRKSNQIRIIGGTHRSRVIQFPDQAGLRPTSDRIRETLFNWLQEDLYNARCLDLFAGSGALGIEALSRGAKHVQFVESSVLAATAIEQNLENLGLAQGGVSQCTAEQWLQQPELNEIFDLIFIDPPYADRKLESVCKLLQQSASVRVGSKVYVENGEAVNPAELPVDWEMLKQKHAGQVQYYLFEVRAKETKE